MTKKFLFIVMVLFTAVTAMAQQIPLGSCGIVCVYDAAGNRTKRLYYCNNGGTYPSFAKGNEIAATDALATGENDKIEFQSVDALYPNPTSGIFYITFSKALKNAGIVVTDNNGKILQQFSASGFKLTCNLATLAAGTYFVTIREENSVITKKVIKQ